MSPIPPNDSTPQPPKKPEAIPTKMQKQVMTSAGVAGIAVLTIRHTSKIGAMSYAIGKKVITNPMALRAGVLGFTIGTLCASVPSRSPSLPPPPRRFTQTRLTKNTPIIPQDPGSLKRRITTVPAKPVGDRKF